MIGRYKTTWFLDAFLLGIVFAQHALAQLPTIELQSLSQPAFQVGSRGEIRVSGSRLDELDGLEFSGAGIMATQRLQEPPLLGDEPVPSGIFDITIDDNTEPGLYDVRASGRFGISNPRALLVTKQPVVRCPSENTEAFSALDLATDTIYLDQAVAQSRKVFRISLKAGEQLSASVYAAQLDSRMVPSLVLYDDQARELRRSRGIRKWPAEIHYAASEPGDYVLAVHDFLYQGGPEYAFLLECKTDTDESQLSSLELDALLRPLLRADHEPSRISNVARANELGFFNGAAASRPTNLVHRAEPNTAPFHVQSTLANGPVSYDFQATKDRLFWLEVKSSQLDQLTDPSLLLFRVNQDPANSTEQLNRVAEQDDGNSVGSPDMRIRLRDPYLAWKVPEDGTYRVTIRDFESGLRPVDSMEFLLEVRDPQPGFRLLAHRLFPNPNRALARPLGSNLMRGGTEAILVTAIRKDGFNGPIEVAINDLPDGVSCPRSVIPRDATETVLVLRAAEDAAHQLSTLNITGAAELNGMPISASALSGSVVWGTTPTNNSITNRLCQALHLRVNALDTAPLLVELAGGQTLEAAQGDSLTIPISVQRREGGATACLLRAQNLPPKSSMTDVQIAADKSEATAELKLNNDVPPGEYTIWMENEARVQWRANPQAHARAEAYLAVLKKALESAEQDEKSRLEAAVQNQAKVVENTAKESAAQDTTVWLPSTAVRIRVLSATQN